MQDFIKIGEQRVRKSSIKKYAPYGDYKMNIYYNTSRYKIENETFSFGTTKERDEFIEKLDLMFVL
jgi:hypothetical protein